MTKLTDIEGIGDIQATKLKKCGIASLDARKCVTSY